MRVRIEIAVASIVSAGAAALAGAAAPAPAQAPLATAHGRVAYNTVAGDIWIMNADGTHRRRLTRSGSGVDFDPDFSPDGRRVVFRTSRGRYAPDRYGIGLEGIFVVDVRTRRQRQIQPRHGGLFPAWSPDGRTIAFSGLRSDGAPVDTIQFMRPDGRELRDTGAMGECATWSPDGSRLAYCAHEGDGNWAIWVMDADGSDRRQLTHPHLLLPAGSHGDYPEAWSPDGTQILYQGDAGGDREIFAIDVDGSNRQRLTHWRGADSPNAWLRDGSIVFGHYTSDAPTPRWYAMHRDGSGIRRLHRLDRAADPLDWLG
jgi:Tol biopolymer transport system component